MCIADLPTIVAHGLTKTDGPLKQHPAGDLRVSSIQCRDINSPRFQVIYRLGQGRQTARGCVGTESWLFVPALRRSGSVWHTRRYKHTIHKYIRTYSEQAKASRHSYVRIRHSIVEKEFLGWESEPIRIGPRPISTDSIGYERLEFAVCLCEFSFSTIPDRPMLLLCFKFKRQHCIKHTHTEYA